MKKILALASLLTVSGSVLAQINRLENQEFDFTKKYSFGDSLTITSPYEALPFEAPKGILDNNPFATPEHQAMLPMRNPMPILHPELEGYNMPVKTPNSDISYSLLIFPPLLPETID